MTAGASADAAPPPSGLAGRPWRLPTWVRVVGIVFDLWGIVGAAALVYLVATSEELVFGTVVDPSEKTNYYLWAWLIVVACGAQLYTLVVNITGQVLWATAFRLVVALLPLVTTPTLELRLSIEFLPLLAVIVNGAILALVIRMRGTVEAAPAPVR